MVPEATSPPAQPPSARCDRALPARTPIRRLNRSEYANTVRDLLGAGPEILRLLPEDEVSGGFSNDADALVVSSAIVADKYAGAAEALAAEAVGKSLGVLAPCSPGGDEVGCGRGFIERFGRRAFRRPLAREEVSLYQSLFVEGKAGGGFGAGIELVLQAMLQAPPFLYRIELGRAPRPGERHALLTSHELAARLSYFLWHTTPDDELLAEADRGLDAPAALDRAVKRMLADPRARQGVTIFHREWLGYGGVSHAAKDPAFYPEWTATVRQLLFDEAATFLDRLFWEDGRLSTMLTAPFTHGGDMLAKYYGAVSPDREGRIQFPPEQQRAGILTLGTLMATYAGAGQSSPVKRGIYVREHLLCQSAPPPPMIDIEEPPPSRTTSTRQRFAEHNQPACAGCHKLFDPVGLGFENLDGIGRWRATDGGEVIDPSGEVFAADDASGAFRGPRELGALLARSHTVQACLGEQWFRFAHGRAPDDGDACTLRHIEETLRATGDVRQVLHAIATSDAIRHRVVD